MIGKEDLPDFSDLIVDATEPVIQLVQVGLDGTYERTEVWSPYTPEGAPPTLVITTHSIATNRKVGEVRMVEMSLETYRMLLEVDIMDDLTQADARPDLEAVIEGVLNPRDELDLA